ncbi:MULTISPECIES: hypothetical protein [Nocardiopsis]|uniref:hypothetical protein n=1 Tax=Nocardiopsis TaxID=2013 RepID=UPI00034B171D|nr:MULTISPECIES: hypothetical protein [Nocardiopsis]
MPDPAPPIRPVHAAAAVLAGAALTAAAGLAVPDPLPFTATVLQRETSPAVYRPFGEAGDPEPVEVLLVRTLSLSGADHRLRLGHDADAYFHEVTVPEATGSDGPPGIASVDWGEEEITVRLESGHAVGVPASSAVGHR